MASRVFKWAALPVLGMSTLAAAGEPYYFHQPGIDREAYAADVTVCRELAGMGEVRNTPVPYSANIYATMATALLSGFLHGAAERRHQAAIERTCMADKGYARVAIAKPELKRIRALPSDEARMDALFTLAAAEEKMGKDLAE